MEKFKYRIGTYIIYPTGNPEVKIVVPKRLEEELTILASEIGDLISLGDTEKRKEEFVKLLKKLNELTDVIYKFAKKDRESLQKGNLSNIDPILKTTLSRQIGTGYEYLFGKISGIRRITISAIKNIEHQQEYGNQMSKEQEKQIIEEAESKEKMDYFG